MEFFRQMAFLFFTLKSKKRFLQPWVCDWRRPVLNSTKATRNSKKLDQVNVKSRYYVTWQKIGKPRRALRILRWPWEGSWRRRYPRKRNQSWWCSSQCDYSQEWPRAGSKCRRLRWELSKCLGTEKKWGTIEVYNTVELLFSLFRLKNKKIILFVRLNY